MSRKRKWGEGSGEAMEGLAKRALLAAVGKYDVLKSLPEQIAYLDSLVIMVSSAAEAAEGVDIKSWHLRRWCWELQEAACDGKGTLRSFRARAAKEAATAGGAVPMARRVLRCIRSLLWGDEEADRIGSMVRRLERLAAGIGEFLKSLEWHRTGADHPAVSQSDTASQSCSTVESGRAVMMLKPSIR